MSIVNSVETPTETAAPDKDSHAAKLELINLEKRYGDAVVARDINLTVEPGEFVTLLGPSGSGKSTTLAMVAGFETPTAGTIRLGNQDITQLVTHKRELGMVFQGYALFPHMSVFDNVAFPLTLRKMSKSTIRQRTMEALETVSLGQFAKRRPSQLSGGQQQRVALARAFVHRPPILLMDEPLSALDKSLRGQMQLELRRLHREIGTTVLFVTHDQEEALGLSDRIVVMNEGQILQCGSPTEMYESPLSEFVAGFLGAANFLDGTIGARASDGLASVALNGGREIIGRPTAEIAKGSAVRVLLRPEDAMLAPAADERCNEFLVRVSELVYLGERIRGIATFLDGSQGVFWLDHRDSAKAHIGQDLTLYWPQSRTVLIGRA